MYVQTVKEGIGLRLQERQIFASLSYPENWRQGFGVKIWESSRGRHGRVCSEILTGHQIRVYHATQYNDFLSRRTGDRKKTGLDMRKNLFDGRMIGLKGEIVVYPKWFFLSILNTQRILDRKAKDSKIEPIKIVERDHATGLHVVRESIRKELGPIIDLPDYKLHALKSMDPSIISGKARTTGKKGIIDLLELGILDRRRPDVE